MAPIFGHYTGSILGKWVGGDLLMQPKRGVRTSYSALVTEGSLMPRWGQCSRSRGRCVAICRPALRKPLMVIASCVSDKKHNTLSPPGCRHTQRGIFSPREIPDGDGSSGPVRPQSRRLAAGGYRMAYRVSPCRRDIPPCVRWRGADVFARALEHLFLRPCRDLPSSSACGPTHRAAFDDWRRVNGFGRGLVDT